ncbi:ricin-type beta-trefoil lectin domain protein [Promicromonospora sp. NPDC050249]|uniref:RICIN domain-containing protein n=1 Tax=Promicromonospora sp. NPDC050249 TaxID=3154743 RepID=UPI0033CFD081
MFASSISRVRMVAAVAITAVMALSMAMFVAAPARADDVRGIENVATRECLDGSISEGLRLMTCNDVGYQDWIARGANPHTFLHVATAKCLDGSISDGVRLKECNTSDYQRWEWRKGENGFALLNIATRKCLDGSISEGVRLMTCNNSDYQRWQYNWR